MYLQKLPDVLLDTGGDGGPDCRFRHLAPSQEVVLFRQVLVVDVDENVLQQLRVVDRQVDRHVPDRMEVVIHHAGLEGRRLAVGCDPQDGVRVRLALKKLEYHGNRTYLVFWQQLV